jgi:predicted nucleic acid-binding protein
MTASSTPDFLDTAVPMYAAGAPHPYQLPCQWLMTEIAGGRMPVVIDAEVVQEILHRYGALGRFADAVAMATDVMTLVPQILPVTAADMQTAVTIFQQYAPRGVRARDAIHAAVMQNHQLPRIISADTHFDLIAGIVRLDPIALHQAASQP